MLVQKVPSRMLDLELHLEFLASSAKIESLGKAQCGEDESLAHLLCIQETKWEHKKGQNSQNCLVFTGLGVSLIVNI